MTEPFSAQIARKILGKGDNVNSKIANLLRQLADEFESAPGATEEKVGATRKSAPSTAKGGTTTKKAAPAEDSGDDEADLPRPTGSKYTAEWLKSQKIVDLRALARAHGVDSKLKNEIIEALEGESVPGGGAGSDDGDEGEFSREDLEGMSIKELRGLGRENDWYEKGMAREDIIDNLLGEDDEDDDEDEEDDEDLEDEEADDDEEEDEDEDDEEDEDEDEEDDDEEVVVTREELNAMTVRALKDLHKEYELKLPKLTDSAKKPLTQAKQKRALVDSIMEQVSEDDDDEE